VSATDYKAMVTEFMSGIVCALEVRSAITRTSSWNFPLFRSSFAASSVSLL